MQAISHKTRMKHFFTLVFSLFISVQASAFAVSGKVTDETNKPVPFASIYIKGTTRGTTSNMDGMYSMDLAVGAYELGFRLIGYKVHIEKVTVTNQNMIVDVKLTPESFQLKEAVINASAEDPAYEIIRQAQKKRKFYLEQVDAYSCDVYIKGVQRIKEKPKKIMGMEVDPDNEIDSATGIVYLSESVSKFNFKQKDKIREEMISSKVSGDNKAFSYNQASDMLFNFYENLLEIDGLSERGFISPISGNAMLSYKYVLLGTFTEDGSTINKIQVIPKRKHDPVFSGIINIMDDSWRIHSLQLVLTKDAQIDFVDTLRVNQLFLPVQKETWLPFSTKFVFDFGFLGIKGDGMFVGVNSNYIINPDFPKHFFTNELMKVNEDANKKDSMYWKDSRPIPLTIEEESDYRKRDSLSKIRNTKEYTDSTDRKGNKFKFKDLFFGYNHSNTFKKRYWSVSGPALGFQFNTVQGFNLSTGFNYSQRYENRKNWNLGGTIGYGFSNRDFYGTVLGNYYYKPQKFANFGFSGGRDYMQFNRSRPILPLINSLYSLFNEQNFMKLYVSNFVNVFHSSELFNGFYFTAGASYSNRSAKVNTTDYTIASNNNDYTSNNPRDTSDYSFSFPDNNALVVNLEVRYIFKQRYYTSPNYKQVMGSKFPTLLVNYRKGINALGSDVNFDFVTVGLEHDLNLKLLGNSRFSVKAGKFLNTAKLYFMDWYHFNGNQTLFSGFRLSDFQLLGYYSESTDNQFIEGHFEHNFGGFFLNKIPLIKRLKLQEIGKAGVLTTDGKNAYGELSVGLKRFGVRAEFVTGFSNQKKISSGFRFGINF